MPNVASHAHEFSIVWISCPADEDVIEKLTNEPLSNELCAAVNRISGVQSSFYYQGSIEKTEEILLIYKTQSCLVKELMDYIQTIHPYSEAEMFSLKLEQANSSFLNTLTAHTKGPTKQH